MWEVSSTLAELFLLPWNGATPLPAGGFDLSSMPRLIGALLLLFILPGVALHRLVLRRYSFGAVATIAITLTLSLTAAIAGGFILNLFPSGLRPRSWIALLSAVTLGSLLVGAAVAAVERYHLLRAWTLQRFGFAGLRLLLRPGDHQADMDAPRGRARAFHALKSAGSLPARAIRGLRRRWERLLAARRRHGTGDLARHQLGFTGVYLWAPPRPASAVRPTLPATAHRERAAAESAANPVLAAPVGERVRKLPHRVLSVALGRRAPGIVALHRLGFVGVEVAFMTARFTPTGWTPAREFAIATRPGWRWYGRTRHQAPPRHDVERDRATTPAAGPVHRLGFGGVRLVPVPARGAEEAPRLVTPGRAAPRERRAPVARAWRLPPYDTTRRIRFSPVQVALLAAALGLTSFAFLNAVTAVQSQRRLGFTQLWITTDRRATVETLSIGVTSQELEVTGFRLQLVSGDRTIAEWPSLQLAPGQSFFARVDVDATTLAVPSVSVVLYRLDRPSAPYRLVQASVPR